MIDLDLFDLLSTIGTGTVAMFAIIYCCFVTLKLFNVRKFNSEQFVNWVKNKLNQEYKKSGNTMLITILIFSLGVMTEDFTDHLADSQVSRNPVVNFLKERLCLLESEGSLRMQSLMDDDKINGLGVAVLTSPFLRNDSNFTKKPNILFNTDDPSKYWRNKRDSINGDLTAKNNFIRLVNTTYYNAKNWCYLKSEPAKKELEEIQTRIDLARSVVLISFITFAIIISLYILYYLNESIIKKKQRRFMIVNTVEESGMKKTIMVRKIFTPFRSIFILAIVFFATRLCYEVAENNFNERAFGYCLSHLKFDKDQ